MAALAGSHSIEVPAGFKVFDLPVMFVSAGVLAAFVLPRRPIGRATGVVLFAGYLVYMYVLLT